MPVRQWMGVRVAFVVIAGREGSAGSANAFSCVRCPLEATPPFPPTSRPPPSLTDNHSVNRSLLLLLVVALLLFLLVLVLQDLQTYLQKRELLPLRPSQVLLAQVLVPFHLLVKLITHLRTRKRRRSPHKKQKSTYLSCQNVYWFRGANAFQKARRLGRTSLL